MHDEEIGVIDVELNGLEEVLESLESGFMPVEEIFGDIADRDLQKGISQISYFGEHFEHTCLVTVI